MQLVGEADGGRELPKSEFKKLLGLYHSSWGDKRVYVHWRNSGGRDCIRVKGPCFCFCGHTFKAHAWYDTGVACRCPDCRCTGFRYLHHQGSWFLQCGCKHPAVEHSEKGAPSGCRHKGCECPAFTTQYSCVCGELWGSHQTVAETEAERRLAGRAVDPEVSARIVSQALTTSCVMETLGYLMDGRYSMQP